MKKLEATMAQQVAKAAGAFVNSFGGFNPLMHRTKALSFYPFEDVPHRPAITADGRLVSEVVANRAPALEDIKAALTSAGALGSTGVIYVPAFNDQTKLGNYEIRKLLVDGDQLLLARPSKLSHRLAGSNRVGEVGPLLLRFQQVVRKGRSGTRKDTRRYYRCRVYLTSGIPSKWAYPRLSIRRRWLGACSSSPRVPRQ